MSGRISVFASFQVREGRRDEFVAVITRQVRESRLEPGCERYDLFEDSDGGFHVFETYRDRSALETHRDSPHLAEFRSASSDLLEQAARVLVLEEREPVG